jgi:hypothetical protein
MSVPTRRRPTFGGGYGVPTGDEGMLEWTWAEKQLAGAHNYWVATWREADYPRSATRFDFDGR